MIGQNNSIKIIDFDWAGKEGNTIYPMHINPGIKWHQDVGPGKPILRIHDKELLESEFTS
jgi:hypothetical protein